MPAPLSAGPHLAGIRLLSCDVDGVLTDGGLYYDKDGYAMARFHVLDGMGLKRLQQAGVRTCFVTQSRSAAIETRARLLGIDRCLMGFDDKRDVVADLASEWGFTLAEVCHIADDVNDLTLLQSVGVPVTVPGGVREVKDACMFETRAEGGQGAVRELCEAIIASRS
ncbi:MAG: KdsC family phosphatase, partial [Cypionkella sp.]